MARVPTNERYSMGEGLDAGNVTAYYSYDEIRPPLLLYLLEEIRDLRSFSQAGNCVHGVQNKPFRACSPSEETLRFQGPARQDLLWNSSVRSMRGSPQQFDERQRSLTGLSPGRYFPWSPGIT